MKQLICLSHAPWSPAPNRTQQLITRLKDVEVLFFEPSDGKTPSPRKVRPNITAYSIPPQLMARLDTPMVGRPASALLRRYFRKILQGHRFREAPLWLTSPAQYPLVRAIPHSGLVYDCDREWDDLPLKWESELALHADVVFAASVGLAQRLSPCSSNIAILPNGVNYTMFSRSDGDLPPLLARCKGPVFCRVGDVTHDLDLEPLLSAASAHPEWNFLLLGRVEEELHSRLNRWPNLLLPGQVPMVDVPDYLRHSQVCFDLLAKSTAGSDILPIRLYEYLAVGKPVVLMLQSEQVEPFPDVVYAAFSPATFLRRCERALEEDPTWVFDRRRSYARGAQWADRAAEIQHILETAALL